MHVLQELFPEQEGMDEKDLEEWEELLGEGSWPDGYTSETRQIMQKPANEQEEPHIWKHPQTLHQMTSGRQVT